MLDKEQFEKEGKAADEIIREAIAGPLLDDYKREENRQILSRLEKFAKGYDNLPDFLKMPL